MASKRALDQQKREQRARCTSQWVYQGRFISLRLDHIEFDTRSSQQWELVCNAGAVAIVPINERGNLLLVQQWRRAIGQITLELPAGGLEKGEAVEVAAQRELQEETGFRAEELIPLGKIFSSPGFCNECLHLFVARCLVASPLQPDEHEAIDCVELSLEEALHRIDIHQITDAKTICGILKYARQKI